MTNFEVGDIVKLSGQAPGTSQYNYPGEYAITKIYTDGKAVWPITVDLGDGIPGAFHATELELVRKPPQKSKAEYYVIDVRLAEAFGPYESEEEAMAFIKSGDIEGEYTDENDNDVFHIVKTVKIVKPIFKVTVEMEITDVV